MARGFGAKGGRLHASSITAVFMHSISPLTQVYLPNSTRFNFHDEHEHEIATHVSPPSVFERLCCCSLTWAHHKAPLKFQATRSITRAYLNIANNVQPGEVPQPGSPQDIALQLRSDIKAYVPCP